MAVKEKERTFKSGDVFLANLCTTCSSITTQKTRHYLTLLPERRDGYHKMCFMNDHWVSSESFWTRTPEAVSFQEIINAYGDVYLPEEQPTN